MNYYVLDQHMREYEESLDQVLPPDVYLVARLDGNRFTRLTKELCDFEAPFDERFREMMVHTVRALMDYGFRVIYGYTQSDEISLLFHPAENAFDRKVRKYNSILAGVASSAFSMELGRSAVFDCRMVPLPTLEEVQDYFRWRQENAYHNALNAHCYWLLRKQGVSGRNAAAQIERRPVIYKKELLLQNGINFDKLPAWQKYGVGLFWKTEEKTGFNPVTGEQTVALRRRLTEDYELPIRKDFAYAVEEILTNAEKDAGMQSRPQKLYWPLNLDRDMNSMTLKTVLSIKGTKADYSKVLKALRPFQKYRYDNEECDWFLDVNSIPYEWKLDQYIDENGVLSLTLYGPFMKWNGSITDLSIINLFEKIAEAVPDCWFCGRAAGWDEYCLIWINAELRDGRLYLRSDYQDYDEEQDVEELRKKLTAKNCVNETKDWDCLYNLQTREYEPISHAVEGDSVTVTISLTDTTGHQYSIDLLSPVIENSIEFFCYPKRFLEANDPEKLTRLLTSSLGGNGKEACKRKITAFGNQLKSKLPACGFQRLELIKIHDHKAPHYFGQLIYKYPELMTLAQRVCNSEETDKKEAVEQFEKYINDLRPNFDSWYDLANFSCGVHKNWVGWPWFCSYQIGNGPEGVGLWLNPEAKTVEIHSDSDGKITYEPKANAKKTVRLDWSSAANSIEDFAKMIYSKECPCECAIERVIVDYSFGTIEQSAVYMPGGSKKKT